MNAISINKNVKHFFINKEISLLYTKIFLATFLSNCFNTKISTDRIKTTTTNYCYFTFGSLTIISKLYRLKKLQRRNKMLHYHLLILLVVHHLYQHNVYVLQDKLVLQVHRNADTKQLFY
jgi:hypothetical protein